jgi:carbon-monoxide dehydrogenase medium subunit
VKPPPFDYLRARSTAEVLDLLPTLGPDARLLAGGQSLVPMLSMRVARPSTLVDIGRLDELNRLGVVDGELYVGALVRHRTLTQHPLVRDRFGVLATAAEHIGHAAIRHRGTLGGSLAHADPSGELLAICLLLDAVLIVESAAGGRHIAARDFVLGPYETVLRPQEMLTWVRLRDLAGRRTGFYEFVRRSGDFATAGAAVSVPPAGRPGLVAAVVFGAGRSPVRTEASLEEPDQMVPQELAARLYPDAEMPEDRLRQAAVLRALCRAGVGAP